MTEASRDTSATAFSDLMRLRLEGQARSRAAEEEPDNLIAWRALDDVERAMVDQAFAQIAALQSRVSHAFLADT